jgi:hypothetical protein
MNSNRMNDFFHNSDYGDSYDSVKWNFPQDSLKIFYIEGYPYKVRDSRETAEYLHYIRTEIDRLTECLSYIDEDFVRKVYNSTRDTQNKFPIDETFEGLRIFMDIHKERPRSIESLPAPFHKRNGTSSKYLLSEFPYKKYMGKCPAFEGLNQPKLRVMTHEKPVGLDGQMRAGYRDVFLDLGVIKRNGLKEFRELIIHELSHTAASHVNFYDDNHHFDFKVAEKILGHCAKQIGFMAR